MNQSLELTSRYGMHTEQFSTLMKHRVLEILLVASHYDAFALEEEGQLTELMFEEYRNLDLNLRYVPRFTRAANAAQALTLLTQRSFDMVVTTPRLPDESIETFISRLRRDHSELPVGLLAAHAWDLPRLESLRSSGAVDWVFLWQGNVTALMAMIKQVEDRLNADHDILEGGVQAIILVEDEVRFYSSYLPHIYTEVTSQTSRLMSEGLNLSHRLLRIRARPKILLAQTYEEAWSLYRRFSKNTLGIITDMGFSREGQRDEEAGLILARQVRERDFDIPILIQSMDESHLSAASSVGASFLCKTNPKLLELLRHYIQDNFGFGDFIFKLPNGTPLGRARDMRELLEQLQTIPEVSLVYHANRNHFSAWLKARTEFELAALLRPRKVEEFSSPADLRAFLIASLNSYLHQIQRHVIADFDSLTYEDFTVFAKVGSGSIGGKGRGLAFLLKLLAGNDLDLPGLSIEVPRTVVLASDVFEEFIANNALGGLAHDAPSMKDGEILDRFRSSQFPPSLLSDLGRLLARVREPLAVRSSSILEDSVYQPFAGVYATVMLPNSHPSIDVRVAQLLEAIRVVFASVFFEQARDYLSSTPFRAEEELMAVLIQRLVGTRRGSYFYPTFSGVASSYNFYPFGNMKPEDGVAQVALGLGKSVVEGFGAMRFCPRYPQVLPHFSTVKDILRNAQRSFWALDMSNDAVMPGVETDANLAQLEAMEAVNAGAAASIASTYSRVDDTITSGLSEGGVPLITFAPVLRGRSTPVADTLRRLLEHCQEGIANPAEIEFAVDVQPGGSEQVFHVLQLRPMVVEKLELDVELDREMLQRALVFSETTLGHGRRETLFDIIVVDPDKLDRSETPQAAKVIESINHRLHGEHRHCILIGPGRWGSRDPWLGIPVAWSQISTARAIVETDFRDLHIEPSLGSHFFHNLTSFGIAFFVVHAENGHGSIRWPWFAHQPCLEVALDGAIRHLRLDLPASVLVDGASGRGIILEPAADSQ